MILTNTGGPILFGSLELKHGRNELTPEQTRELLAGCAAFPGWRAQLERLDKSGQLTDRELPPPAPRVDPAESLEQLKAREAAQAAAERELIDSLPGLTAAELDELFAKTQTPGPLLDAIVDTMKARAKAPAPSAAELPPAAPPPAPVPPPPAPPVG